MNDHKCRQQTVILTQLPASSAESLLRCRPTPLHSSLTDGTEVIACKYHPTCYIITNPSMHFHRMLAGINGEGELRGQPANPGSPGKMAVKTECAGRRPLAIDDNKRSAAIF